MTDGFRGGVGTVLVLPQLRCPEPGTWPSSPHRALTGTMPTGAQQLPPHPPLPRLLDSAPLCRHLGVSRPWGWLPSGGSILVLLAVEQVPLEKAGEVAMIQQDSQRHPCKRPGVGAQGPQDHCNSYPRPSLGQGACGPGPGGRSLQTWAWGACGAGHGRVT